MSIFPRRTCPLTQLWLSTTGWGCLQVGQIILTALNKDFKVDKVMMKTTGRNALTGFSFTVRTGKTMRWWTKKIIVMVMMMMMTMLRKNDRWCRMYLLIDLPLQVEEMEQMDIPVDMRDMSAYCATSAHKINHSFQPNCRFSRFNHPRWNWGNNLGLIISLRFGPLPCVTTTQHIKQGDELFSYYRF